MVSNNFWWHIHFKKFTNIWKIIRDKIEENTADIVQYDKNYMKIKFESNDNLPTDNTINMHQVTIIIRLVFQRNEKLYRQIYLDDCLYKS